MPPRSASRPSAGRRVRGSRGGEALVPASAAPPSPPPIPSGPPIPPPAPPDPPAATMIRCSRPSPPLADIGCSAATGAGFPGASIGPRASPPAPPPFQPPAPGVDPTASPPQPPTRTRRVSPGVTTKSAIARAPAPGAPEVPARPPPAPTTSIRTGRHRQVRRRPGADPVNPNSVVTRELCPVERAHGGHGDDDRRDREIRASLNGVSSFATSGSIWARFSHASRFGDAGLASGRAAVE